MWRFRGQSQVTTFVFHLEMGVSCGWQQGLLVVCHCMDQASWPGSYSEYPVCTSSLAVGALRLHTDAATVPSFTWMLEIKTRVLMLAHTVSAYLPTEPFPLFLMQFLFKSFCSFLSLYNFHNFLESGIYVHTSEKSTNVWCGKCFLGYYQKTACMTEPLHCHLLKKRFIFISVYLRR